MLKTVLSVKHFQIGVYTELILLTMISKPARNM